MFEPGDPVFFHGGAGPKVKAKVVDIIPDIDATFYALEVTSRKHPRYQVGTELWIRTDDDRLTYRGK